MKFWIWTASSVSWLLSGGQQTLKAIVGKHQSICGILFSAEPTGSGLRVQRQACDWVRILTQAYLSPKPTRSNPARVRSVNFILSTSTEKMERKWRQARQAPSPVGKVTLEGKCLPITGLGKTKKGSVLEAVTVDVKISECLLSWCSGWTLSGLRAERRLCSPA